ncbi:MAG: cyclomaltodextrinase C-terminal domain-containing protein, partial [Chitinophagaceae bacterium]|nr:cyclomaltodextrinase C-terminal domain-containing protein [Chitinophagaceae bacterium]
ALVQMALGYLLTIRGIPQIYYGTEVLIENTAKPGDHGLIRTDFPGGWSDDRVNGFTGSGLSADQQRVKDYTKKLLNWRKTKPVIHEGKTLHFIPEKGVYVYFRYDAKDTVMVIVNKNTTNFQLPTRRFSEILAKKNSALNVMTGEQITIGTEISLTPKSTIILELK